MNKYPSQKDGFRLFISAQLIRGIFHYDTAILNDIFSMGDGQSILNPLFCHEDGQSLFIELP